jgi:predicted  nucleic acid-binding Zn-ribbon protein
LGWLHERDPRRAREAFAALDGVRAELDRNTSVLGEVRDRVHDSLRGEVDRLRSHATALEVVRKELQNRIEALEREADLLRQNVSALQQNAVALQHEVSAARADAEALRKSASWRVTTPLRAVYRMFR